MMQMAFSYFPQKVLLGFALMHSHRKNSLLSNIMHSYVLSGLMAKACKKLKYNSKFFFGGKNHIQIVLLCEQKKHRRRFYASFVETFPLSPVRMFVIARFQHPKVDGRWMFMMVCNKSLLNSCPSGRKRKALNAQLYFTGEVPFTELPFCQMQSCVRRSIPAFFLCTAQFSLWKAFYCVVMR